MIRTQVYLPDDLYSELKLLASKSKENFSELIRQGAREVIKKKKAGRKKDWRKFIGAAGKGGPRDVASKIDYYLYGKGNPKWAKHW